MPISIPVIEVEGLVKFFGFRESLPAIDHVSFTVAKGVRFGILGAKGAGKTTTLGILATILRPSEGKALVDGHDVTQEPYEVRKLVGYMPQELDLRGWSSVRQYLNFWARMGGLPWREQKSRIEQVAEFLNLETEVEEKPALSTTGIQRRLAFAQALLTEPEVLLLDEPVTGVGETERAFFLERVRDFTRQGTTIVMTSPSLTDVAQLCDKVAVMHEGKLTRVYSTMELLSKIGETKNARVFVDCDQLSSKAMTALKDVEGVVDVQSTPTTTIVYILPTKVTVDTISKILESQGVKARGIRSGQMTLGDVFNALYR